MMTNPQQTALFLGAFFDELTRWGVRDVVISPGSRSTPLSMVAYELSRRFPERLRLFVDVDERGAAFFALGLAKASGHPAALICTSGTAVANYYPAVLEAESSRVPLMVLTGDRPPRLQGLGAPQTCDQLKAYGDHVRAFRAMPLPAADDASLAFARQAAREACIAANPFGFLQSWQGDVPEGGLSSQIDRASAVGEPPRIAGACCGGPVHVNFPFDEPLKPDLSVEGLFGAGLAADASREAAALTVVGAPILQTHASLTSTDAERVAALLRSHRTLVLAGEGTCATAEEAEAVLTWAHAYDVPLLADPLSGLRSCNDAYVIDNYDTVFGSEQGKDLLPDVIVRFGRWPISKRATQALAAAHPFQIVVDPLETRDTNANTNLFVPAMPTDFARSLVEWAQEAGTPVEASADVTPTSQASFAASWVAVNDAARVRIQAVDQVDAGFEGAFVRRVAKRAPEGSCLFAASSMSVRALDTFYLKEAKRLAVLCNRGLNGIDGTVSSAIGAAQYFAQTTLVTGDLTLLHDLNALALQRELRVQRQERPDAKAPSIVVVLLNNNGGAIFDMLPQKSADPYFERLFLTPQDVSFADAARAFDVPYQTAETVTAFDDAYRAALGVPGISLIEVRVPLEGLRDRYAEYWK